jgi:uncharacterized protein YkwD
MKYRKYFEYALLIIAIVAAFGLVTALKADATHVYPRPTNEKGAVPTKPDVYSLWQDTNAERVKAGLQPLMLDPELNKNAEAKCSAMAAEDAWNHKLKDGRRADAFMTNETKWNENLAQGANTSQDAVTAWMASTEGHKEALLDATHTREGFAVCSAPSYPNIVVQFLTH